jgi:hypothetical protein
MGIINTVKKLLRRKPETISQTRIEGMGSRQPVKKHRSYAAEYRNRSGVRQYRSRPQIKKNINRGKV